jgi:hypothetical protein
MFVCCVRGKSAFHVIRALYHSGNQRRVVRGRDSYDRSLCCTAVVAPMMAEDTTIP